MKTNLTHIPSNKLELPLPAQVFNWAEEAMQKKQWLAATRRWAVFRRAYPDHPAPWFQGINAHIEAGQLDEAGQLLAYAEQKFPNHPNMLIASATLAIQLEEWDRAKALLSSARSQHPKQILTWMKSAELAKKVGDLTQAATYYQSATRCAPDYPAPWIEYAELAMQTEEWDEALKRWARVRELFPRLHAGYHRAAEAARRMARPQESRKLALSHQYGPELFDDNTDSPPPPRHRGNRFNALHLLELIWTKAVFNLRSEVQRNYLSYGWWLLEPLLHMAVYYIVFGLLLDRGGENFPVFLLTGLIPWMWFMKAVSGSSSSILHGQNLLLQVGLPSIALPLINILQVTLKQIPVFLLLFGFVWFQGYSPGSHWWGLLAVIAIQLLLTTVFSCAVAAIIPFIRDLAYLVPTGLTFLMFLSGIFYDYRIISPELQELFLMNPVAFLITSYREIFMDGVLPDFATLIWWGLGSGISLLLLVLAFQRLRYIYPRIVLE